MPGKNWSSLCCWLVVAGLSALSLIWRSQGSAGAHTPCPFIPARNAAKTQLWNRARTKTFGNIACNYSAYQAYLETPPDFCSWTSLFTTTAALGLTDLSWWMTLRNMSPPSWECSGRSLCHPVPPLSHQLSHPLLCPVSPFNITLSHAPQKPIPV